MPRMLTPEEFAAKEGTPEERSWYLQHVYRAAAIAENPRLGTNTAEEDMLRKLRNEIRWSLITSTLVIGAVTGLVYTIRHFTGK